MSAVFSGTMFMASYDPNPSALRHPVLVSFLKPGGKRPPYSCDRLLGTHAEDKPAAERAFMAIRT